MLIVFYSYDHSSDALVVETHVGVVARSVRDGNLILDFDDRGWLLSVTVLGPSEKLLRGTRKAREAMGRSQAGIVVPERPTPSRG